jgi:hypothetical protein
MTGLPLLPVVLLAGGLLDLGIALGLYLYMEKLRRKVEEVRRNWRQVPANVLSSHVAEKSGENCILYSPEIRYEYQFEGMRYETDRWNVYPKWSGSNREPHRKIVDAFPRDREVTAWVNPRNPVEAALSIESPLPKTLRLILIILLATAFLTMAGGALFWIFRPQFPS